MGLLSRITPWDEDTYGNKEKTLRVLIECEKGSVHKREFDDVNDIMITVRDLYPKFKYPFNYGSVPQTLAGDGDSLDAIVLSGEPFKTGEVVNCRIIGIIRMEDNGEQDDKLLCIPYFVGHGTINLRRIIKYLNSYKFPSQEGTKILGMHDAEAAAQAVEDAHIAWQEAQRSKK